MVIKSNSDTKADGSCRTDEQLTASSSNVNHNGQAANGDFKVHQDSLSTAVGTSSNDDGNPFDAEAGFNMSLAHSLRSTVKFHEGMAQLKITRANKLFAFCAAINSCNLGYDIGVNTGAGMLLQNSLDLSDHQIEVFMGAVNLFGLIGALSSHWFLDKLGRRWAFRVAAIGFIIGVVIQSAAYDYVTLMIGRTFIGMGVGFGLALDPVYISEISQAAHRGQLVTWSELGINVGICLGFLSGLIFSSIDENIAWRLMFSMGAILPILVIYLATVVMPESPRWLVSKNREKEAQEVLKMIYPEGYDVSLIVTEIREEIQKEKYAKNAIGWNMIFFPSPAFRRMLMVGIGTAAAQQAVGIDGIQYFLVYILDDSGIKSRYLQMGILTALGVIKMLMVAIAGHLFDRTGRRPLFFVSLSGMMVALLLISLSFYQNLANQILAVFGLAIYLAFYSLGMGPGAWLIPSEVFSTLIRAKAMSVATFMNRVTATLVSSTFLSVANAMSWSGFFLLLAAVCVIVLVWMFVYLPETKGRPLEEMSHYFAEITGDRSIIEAEKHFDNVHIETVTPNLSPEIEPSLQKV